MKKFIYFLTILLLIGIWLLACTNSAAKTPELAPEVAQAAAPVETPALSPTPAPGADLPPKEGHLSGGGVGKTSGGHPTIASRPGIALEVQADLEAKKSPLAPYAASIAGSDYWSLIIAICVQEQYNCTRAPGWNFWGLKGTGDCGKSAAGFAIFCTAGSAITEINQRLINYSARFGPTIEDWRGRYCVSASDPGGVCWNWEYNIIKQKAILETE